MERRKARALAAGAAAVAVIAVAAPAVLASSARPARSASPRLSVPARPDTAGPARSVPARSVPAHAMPVHSLPAPRLRSVRFTVTVNGQRPAVPPPGQTGHPKPPPGCGRSPADPCPGNSGAGVTVTPGEHLSIRVTVTIPARARLAGLWLGISDGTFGTGRTGPVGLQPVLALIQADLQPGPHAYRLAWRVPAAISGGTILWLAAAWTGMLPLADPGRPHQPLTSASVAMPVTAFFVPR
jgi:hypothetical protein